MKITKWRQMHRFIELFFQNRCIYKVISANQQLQMFSIWNFSYVCYLCKPTSLPLCMYIKISITTCNLLCFLVTQRDIERKQNYCFHKTFFFFWQSLGERNSTEIYIRKWYLRISDHYLFQHHWSTLEKCIETRYSRLVYFIY